MSLSGIDISYWQKGNYKALIDTYGKDFVIARGAFDKTVDSYCDPIYQYAKSKGKKLGIYFFPLSKKYTAVNHAQWAYAQVKNYIGEAIIFLDWESYNNHNVADTEWALAWLKEFERVSGTKPVIYMNTSCENSYNWSKVVANGNGLWIANYGANNGKNNGYGKLKYWKILALHQYTSKGTSAGLDMDIFYGDKEAWSKYAKCTKSTSTSATADKPTTEATTKPDTTHTPSTSTSTDDTPNWFITFIKKLAEFLMGLFK